MNRSNPHAHSIADPGHAHSAWNTGIPDFSMSIGGSGVGMLSDNAGAPFRYQAGVSVAAAGTGIGIYGTDINHEHAISAQGGAGSPVHNNMQPYQVVNFIIKT
jgi:microcystin-dependent protein